jgi:transcriptional regulator with XRE-family HTH domain
LIRLSILLLGQAKIDNAINFDRNYFVSNLSETLIAMQQAKGMNGLALADTLGMDPAIISRLLNDRQPVGHVTVARLIVHLDGDEARRLLQAYFDDELARITAGRIEKARELGIRVPKRPWSFKVRIEDED